MALKGDRKIVEDDISFHLNEVAERGVVCWISTAGSGAALDQSVNLVTATGSVSGVVPVGLLLGDMVDKDLTRQHLNFYKDETQKGGKVCLLRRGWVRSNSITGTPTGGGKAYLTTNGIVTPTLSSTGGLVATPLVGQFLASKDEDGYAKVYINLP